MTRPTYHTVDVRGLRIFYREAGPKDAPVVLLLHGYPTSSRMFEPLLSRLGARHRLIAPDYPGFGHSDMPDPATFAYTFDHLAQVIDDFTQALGFREGIYSVQAGMARHIGGRPHPERYNPDLWMDEIAFARRPGQERILLDLICDYRTNPASYGRWQAYLGERRPRTLVVWGKYDPAFSAQGAHAIQRDLPEAELHFLEGGHNAINDLPTRSAR